MSIGESIVLCIFLYAIISGFMHFETERQARIERMVMRMCDLVEQGKLTENDMKRIKEVIDD